MGEKEAEADRMDCECFWFPLGLPSSFLVILVLLPSQFLTSYKRNPLNALSIIFLLLSLSLLYHHYIHCKAKHWVVSFICLHFSWFLFSSRFGLYSTCNLLSTAYFSCLQVSLSWVFSMREMWLSLPFKREEWRVPLILPAWDFTQVCVSSPPHRFLCRRKDRMTCSCMMMMMTKDGNFFHQWLNSSSSRVRVDPLTMKHTLKERLHLFFLVFEMSCKPDVSEVEGEGSCRCR